MPIRPFRPDDLPRLKELTVAAFDGVSIDQGMERLYGPINGHNWQWRKARHLDDDLARDPQGTFVLEENGAVIGYVSTWRDEDAGIGHIPNLVVAAGHRGQGRGRQLLEHVFAHFRAHGLTHAKIETLEQNPIGRHLYPSLGFREVARQIHFLADLRASRSPEE